MLLNTYYKRWQCACCLCLCSEHTPNSMQSRMPRKFGVQVKVWNPHKAVTDSEGGEE